MLYRNPPLLCWMLVLVMTAYYVHQIPTVLFQQLDHLSALHPSSLLLAADVCKSTHYKKTCTQLYTTNLQNIEKAAREVASLLTQIDSPATYTYHLARACKA